jgi:hypothetical protein
MYGKYKLCVKGQMLIQKIKQKGWYGMLFGQSINK